MKRSTVDRKGASQGSRRLGHTWRAAGVLVAGLFIMTVLFAPATPARAGWDDDNTVVWTATVVKGQVSYREGGKPAARWIPLKVGGLLSSLAELRTGPTGHAELHYQNSKIVAAPNSEFKLPGPTRKGAIYRVTQKVGTFLYKIKHHARDRFQVQTPYLTTIIKGTIFTVLASPSGTSVHVIEGAVFVQPAGSNGGSFVRPGETAHVSKGNRDHVIMQGKRASATPGKKGNANAAPGKQGSRDFTGPDKRAQGGGKTKIVFRESVAKATGNHGNGPSAVLRATRNGQSHGSAKQNDVASLGSSNGNGNSNAGLGGAGGSGNSGGLSGGNGNSGGLGGGNGTGNSNAGGNAASNGHGKNG